MTAMLNAMNASGYGIPVGTMQAQASALSSADVYPWFTRTALYDDKNFLAMRGLLLYLKLYQVGLIYSTDTFSKNMAVQFLGEAVSAGMDVYPCVDLNPNTPSSAENVARTNACLDRFLLLGIKTFVLYVVNSEVGPLATLLKQRNMYGSQYLYFLSEQIDASQIGQSGTWQFACGVFFPRLCDFFFTLCLWHLLYY
jgi:hypothetical protein